MRVLELGNRVGVGLLGRLLARFGATVSVLTPTPIPPCHKWRNPAAALFTKAKLDPPDLDAHLRQADIILAATDLAPLPAWQRTPGQILCDITAHPPGSPRAGMADTDAAIQALSGIAATTGMPGEPPVIAACPMLEGLAALHAAIGALAACHVRQRTGLGQDVAVALYDCAIAAQFWPVAHRAAGEPAGRRIGNRHHAATPWNTYRAADADVIICTDTDAQFRRLAATIGAPTTGAPLLAADPRFAIASARRAHAALLDGIVAEWAARRPAAEIVARLAQAGLPAAAIATHEAVLADHNLAVRGAIAMATDPLTNRALPVASCPIHAYPRPMPGPPPAAAAPPPAGTTPLAGIRVVEVGHYVPAPLAGSYLAALGAEVVKVEPPGGDPTRAWPPAPDGQGLVFGLLNTGKRSRALNLRRPDGQRSLRRLLATADVLVENLRPGALARMGLDAYAITQASPGIISCSISGYGAFSAFPERPAFDPVAQATSGIMDRTRAGRAAYGTAIPICAIAGGLAATVGILAGLLRPGGADIDISLHDIGPWLTQWDWYAPPVPPIIRPTQDGHELVEHGQATPIRTATQALDSAETRAANLLLSHTDSHGHTWPGLAFPPRLSRTPLRANPPTGSTGETGNA